MTTAKIAIYAQKGRDGDRAGCCEQCGGRGDHEQGFEVSRDWHPLLYHFSSRII
jgi:hypothetical protein